MRLGTRLSIFLVVPTVLLILLFAWIDQTFTRRLLREELAREARAKEFDW